MVGELIMLPVRVGVRATQLWFRAVEETVSISTGVTERLVGLIASRGSDGAAADVQGSAPADAPGSSSGEEQDAVGARDADRARDDAGAHDVAAERDVVAARDLPSSAMPAPAREAEPAHVSEEPALVEEFAEPGAEDGAGAEVRVDPPWDGYEELNAKQVVSRLADADPAELAAVELYETSHRRRQTILNAVQRELRTRNGSGARASRTA